MAKAILETSMETSINTNSNTTLNINLSTNLNISTYETIQAQRICTETDHLLKTIMEAHLEEQASQYLNQRKDKKMG